MTSTISGTRGALMMSRGIGGCCGQNIIYGFPQGPSNSLWNLKADMEDLLSRYHEDHDDYADTLGEENRHLNNMIVLTERQCGLALDKEGTKIRPFIEGFGFREVFKWVNANSGNVCIAFMYPENEVKSE